MTEPTLPEAVEHLNIKDPNPSTVHVYVWLTCWPSPLRTTDLVEKTSNSQATVERALRRLRDAGVIREVPCKGTARETYYTSEYP